MNEAALIVEEKNNFKSLNSSFKFDLISLEKYPIEKIIEFYHESNNKHLLEIVTNKMTNLVHKVCQEFKNTNIEYEDLLQIGMTGLLIAINKFKSDKNNKFTTFAYFYIRGEMLHHLRDKNLINFPRWIIKTNKMLTNFINDFNEKNDREPSIEEISVGLNISTEGIEEILKSRKSLYYHESLDITVDNDDFAEYSLNDKLIKSRNIKSFSMVIEDKIMLWDAIDKLTGRQKKAFISNYVLGLSQQEIGKKMGISQKTVSKHLNEAVQSLKSKLT